jgi:hypothetical protein
MRVSIAASVPVCGALLLLLATGCSSSSDSGAPAAEVDAGSADTIANQPQADLEYQQGLSDVSAAYATCVAAGQCADPSTVDAGGITTPQSLHIVGVTRTDGLISSVSGLLSSVPNTICTILTPVQDYQQVFFFIGGSGSIGAIKTYTVGVDAVWDLWDQQFAGFWYQGSGLSTLVGVSASVYTGLGFGANKANVVDAWSGYFRAAGVSVSFPGAKFGLSGSAFIGSADGSNTSFDTSIVGGAISLDVGFSLIPSPATITPPAGAQVSGAGGVTAYWKPWNAITDYLGPVPWWGVGGSTVSPNPTATANDGSSYEYIQYNSPKSTAYSLIGTSGPLGGTAAALAIGLGVIKAHNWTIKGLCGAGSTLDAGPGSLLH